MRWRNSETCLEMPATLQDMQLKFALNFLLGLHVIGAHNWL